MRAFDYLRPASIEEACALLSAGDGSVRVLAGGTDLLVQMKQGKVQPRALVSLRDVPGLSFVRLGRDGGLDLGAATPLGMLENSPEILKSFPAVAEAASCIGSVQVRSRATVGGNLCNSAPSADMAPILIAFGAQAVIAGKQGESVVPLEEFFIGPGQTVLKTGELLKALTVPPAPAGSFGKYVKAFRSAMDIATVGVGALVVFAPGSGASPGVVEDVRLVLGAVAPTPIRAREAEQTLVGQALDEQTIARASRTAAQEARPITDVRASAEYRTTLVEVLSRRALRAAAFWVEQGGRG
jgi:CO/xanthine dehydrogenase FAD-binding subunit